MVTPGEEITVTVLRVDEDTQKIALGLKQLTADPWSDVESRYQPGQVHTGRVTRLAEFGAFVELAPGIEGLAHVSTFAPTGRSEQWSKSVTVGMTGAFEILSIDLEKKRIGLALVPEGRHEPRMRGREADRVSARLSEPDAEDLREYTAREDAAPAEGFGSLADKLRGALEPHE